VIAVWVYRDMKLKDVPRVLLSSANMSAMILYIITNAVLFSFLMTSEQIPQAITAWITGAGIGWVEFLLFVNIILLLAGNAMEPSSIVLIIAPILFPVAVGLGINPIHLGILMTVNMEVGLCHPPVGLSLRHCPHGHYRAHHRDLAVAGDHADFPRHGDLYSGAVALAAANAWYAVTIR
jgi:C4-dicarboxylate transporter, DctM subunit